MTRPVTRTVTPPRAPDRPPRVSPGRYRRRRLAAALIALLLLVGLGLTVRVLLYDLGLADVEDVRVTTRPAGGASATGAPIDAGAATVPVGDVLAAAAVPPGGPLAAVDAAAIAGRVAQLPAVESARVRRIWPDTVTIDITERLPVAVTSTVEGDLLVDRSGVGYRATPVPGLPRLTVGSPGPDDPSTRAAVTVLAALPERVRSQVQTVGVTVAGPGGPGQVTLGLTEGREVRWGPPERVPEKAAVLGPLLGRPGSAYDVTTPDLPTVRP